ncbi:hypothetical protein [Emticicia sp. C21]|uniref:hypothetical protein n=1 Tax=Emticicia sp. C21 TaxID=2302915 RepID=UPI000E346803|nr:hypothetical protein [Emticicia sp. C21]RFS18362.1 hypothetical protein D0T08_03690 [Emticicia sp. C21]
MRKTITKLLVIFTAGLLTLSCDKKNEEISPANQMGYDGKTYDISQGFTHLEENNDKDKEEIILTLLTSSFKVQHKDGKIESFSGTMTGVYLWVYTKKGSKGLEPGEYIADTNYEEKPNTFSGGIELNADPNDPTDDFEAYLNIGKLTVKKNNSIYEVALECVDENGKKVKLFYKGEIINLQ